MISSYLIRFRPTEYVIGIVNEDGNDMTISANFLKSKTIQINSHNYFGDSHAVDYFMLITKSPELNLKIETKTMQ